MMNQAVPHYFKDINPWPAVLDMTKTEKMRKKDGSVMKNEGSYWEKKGIRKRYKKRKGEKERKMRKVWSMRYVIWTRVDGSK